MTNEKILEVLSRYRTHLQRYVSTPTRWAPELSRPRYYGRMAHLLWMVDEAADFVETGRKEKAFRWLGFIQGVLWSAGAYTIEELANHSRP